ncbi:MAG: hypothetical protein GWN01_13005 [Nitrosopumilaceae archaeon]|nr:hypothetical protein [Nitrosopumilaceae archaeon]NIU01782.1 hypothetical protein [Nitrosopumilaceae archaeon]NIU88182.1 hypothetical protein [Nitrosopumilaceae archaeon]NIV66505.1 hypothetical protein [Nitrosopumilaceae archaeon]NIX62384.1 hypothetical protein [Nitrosopumilaceae archaeon]
MIQESISKTKFKSSFPRPSGGELVLGMGCAIYLATLGHVLLKVLG